MFFRQIYQFLFSIAAGFWILWMLSETFALSYISFFMWVMVFISFAGLYALTIHYQKKIHPVPTIFVVWLAIIFPITIGFIVFEALLDMYQEKSQE